MEERTAESDRMSGFESLMWELERDPHLSSAFANVTIFDRTPDRAVFRARMEQATHDVPRLRQRVVESRSPAIGPRWVEDPDFDLDHHVRWVDLGGDADERALYDLAATLSRQPFDRQRPLWEFVTIVGLGDGRAAMLQRLHHTITDGEGGIRLSLAFLDFERVLRPTARRRLDSDSREPDAQGADPADSDTVNGLTPHDGILSDAGTDAGPMHDSEAWWQRATAPITSTAVSAASGVTSLAEQATSLVEGAIGGVTSLPGRSADLAGLARSTLRQAKVGSRRSPIWTERSLDRWFGTTQLELAAVKEASHRLGGSVNDFFITGAAAAAGTVHEQQGHPVPELRVSMPVSTRHDRSVGGNAFSPTQSLVPTSDMDPVERFSRISQILTVVKAERAITAMEGAATVASRLPSIALVRTGQYLAGSVDFVCSNVRAAPFDLYIAGALMEANYPMGPLAGTAFNLTTMSYRGILYLGLLVDTASVQDPEGLLSTLVASYDELFAAAG